MAAFKLLWDTDYRNTMVGNVPIAAGQRYQNLCKVTGSHELKSRQIGRSRTSIVTLLADGCVITTSPEQVGIRDQE